MVEKFHIRCFFATRNMLHLGNMEDCMGEFPLTPDKAFPILRLTFFLPNEPPFLRDFKPTDGFESKHRVPGDGQPSQGRRTGIAGAHFGD